MPLYRDEAVILRTHKLGEADRIITMLGRTRGKIRAVAKGVRRTSSKFGARLEPFMVVDAQLIEGRSLDTITQAVSLASYGAEIVADYPSYTAATAIVETADRLTDADSSVQQYLLLLGALRSLSMGEHDPDAILHSYLLRALSVAGWRPSFSDCARCGEPGPHAKFVIPLGGSVCTNCAPAGGASLNHDVLRYLSMLLSGDWELIATAPEQVRRAGANVVTAYTQYHLERGVNSLKHVVR